MNAWTYLLLAFMSGLAMGAIFTASLLKAKLNLYRQFAESRLSALNLPQTSVSAGGVRRSESFELTAK